MFAHHPIESTVFETILVAAGQSRDGVVFTEDCLRAVAKNKNSTCLKYDEDTKTLRWVGLLYGKKE